MWIFCIIYPFQFHAFYVLLKVSITITLQMTKFEYYFWLMIFCWGFHFCLFFRMIEITLLQVRRRYYRSLSYSKFYQYIFFFTILYFISDIKVSYSLLMCFICKIIYCLNIACFNIQGLRRIFQPSIAKNAWACHMRRIHTENYDHVF